MTGHHLKLLLIMLVFAANVPTGESSSGAPPRHEDPFHVIAHRGASGERPEHTLAAYELAARQGADFIEPDLVMTQDRVLVARHENALAILDSETGTVTEATTDVADRPEFADRRTSKIIDGQPITGWFSEDFTLAELKRLRARERLPHLRPKNTEFDGQFEIATFAEILRLAEQLTEELGRPIGVYPELKHPGYFRSIGLPLEEAVVAELATFDGPVFVQSFEPTSLRRVRQLLETAPRREAIRLTQLIASSGGPADRSFERFSTMITATGLAEIATFADAIGPAKSLVIPVGEDGTLSRPTPLVELAHEAGLLVHPWTFRAENQFLPPRLRLGTESAVHGDMAREIATFRAASIDGLFCDHPGYISAAP